MCVHVCVCVCVCYSLLLLQHQAELLLLTKHYAAASNVAQVSVVLFCLHREMHRALSLLPRNKKNGEGKQKPEKSRK